MPINLKMLTTPKSKKYYSFLILVREFANFAIMKWKNGEITAVIFMEMLELKKNTFYKIMKEYEEVN
ncbi:hypothetical protein COD09_29025 [Bacillus cereus]|uniref:Integrase n=1 Tax=Bacillus cereus TaxID=1396 RepID=A0A2C1CRP1_BACCE|nr:hypothetical protein COD09_29025 [Bacillus cereus]